MPELFTEDLIPTKNHKNAYEDEEADPIQDDSGQVLVDPRIIGGETEGTKTSNVTFTFYEDSVAQETGKGIPKTIMVDRACTIDKVYIHVETAPGAGTEITVDVHLNGTTIFTNQAGRPSITGTDTEAESGSPNVVALKKDDKLTMDIDTSDGIAAKLSVYVRCK